MMNCEMFLRLLDAYCDGTLDDRRSAEIEAHATECSSCEARLEQATTGLLPPFAPALPVTLRAQVLQAVAARRRASRTRISTGVGVAVAAAALIAIMFRPIPGPSQLVVVADTMSVPVLEIGTGSMSAEERARSEFRALDDAARELQAALSQTPADAQLTAFLRSIDDQRAALRRQVQDAQS